MSKAKWFVIGIVATIAIILGFLVYSSDADGQTTAPSNTGISGTMDIAFNTRISANRTDGSPNVGVKDVYNLSLLVNGNRKIEGTITRQPRIKQMMVRTVQRAQYDFSLKLAAVRTGSSDTRTVGSWIGAMPTDPTSGAYILDGGGDLGRALRVSVDVGTEIRDNFGGRMYGKADDKSKLSISSIKRIINGKVVERKFQDDPMRFDSMVLAEGPDKGRYPRCTVTGELSYAREEGNYYPKNLRMHYVVDGHEIEDTISGSIKWIEDPNRASNGKGRYEFNLRWNEETHKKAPNEDAAFAGLSSEDAFFAVDNSMPSLVGTVGYVDTMSGDTVTASKVTYDLKGNGLTQQQVMNFAKLWIIAVGPTNDE